MPLPSIRGLQEFCILAVLSRLREARATQVHAALESCTGRDVRHSHVPTTLAALEKKGLLRSRRMPWTEMRDYPIYRLTPAGRKAFEETRAYLEAALGE